MRIVIDTDQRSCTVDGRELLLDSPAAFAVVSEVWLRMGLHLGHWTTFSWLGRQLVQLPDDAWRLAEALALEQTERQLEGKRRGVKK